MNRRDVEEEDPNTPTWLVGLTKVIACLCWVIVCILLFYLMYRKKKIGQGLAEAERVKLLPPPSPKATTVIPVAPQQVAAGKQSGSMNTMPFGVGTESI